MSIEVMGEMRPRFDEVLSVNALQFLSTLHDVLGRRPAELLATRKERRVRVANGEDFKFLPETVDVRNATWTVPPPAPGLSDRKVEITGPPTRKMTINALNSGASVWLSDFEDASTPTWGNMVEGQLNLMDALDRKIDFRSDEGKTYELLPDEDLSTIVVRPRGLHLLEKHITCDGQAMSASLFDFGLYVYHCSGRQLAKGKGPYLYLPKIESHFEARFWNDACRLAEELLVLPRGSIRVTVLIETIPAAFEMDEILFELRERSAGLNAGRWDYLFSMIKYYGDRGSEFLLPNRNAITMTVPFMKAYTDLLVKTCHRRGAHAIGGMSAFIPNRNNPSVTEAALAKVRDDKQREANDGFDGSWVAHPDLVGLCRRAFDEVLGEHPHQLTKQRDDVVVFEHDLLEVASAEGVVSESGLRNNVTITLRYLDSWLDGTAALALFDLMEDAATAEICRAQLWQWWRNGVTLSDGSTVTKEVIAAIANKELTAFTPRSRAGRLYDLFAELALSDELPDFLTTTAYEDLG